MHFIKQLECIQVNYFKNVKNIKLSIPNHHILPISTSNATSYLWSISQFDFDFRKSDWEPVITDSKSLNVDCDCESRTPIPISWTAKKFRFSWRNLDDYWRLEEKFWWWTNSYRILYSYVFEIEGYYDIYKFATVSFMLRLNEWLRMIPPFSTFFIFSIELTYIYIRWMPARCAETPI